MYLIVWVNLAMPQYPYICSDIILDISGKVFCLFAFCFFFFQMRLTFKSVDFFLIMIFTFSIIPDLQCSVNFLLHSKVTQSHIHMYILFLTLSSIVLHHKRLDVVLSAKEFVFLKATHVITMLSQV